MSQRTRAAGVVAAGLIVAVASTGPAAAVNPIRKQIKQARKDLVAFETELSGYVKNFKAAESHLEAASTRARLARRVLKRLDRASTFTDRALADLLLEPLARAELRDAVMQRQVLEELVPEMRRHIWTKSLEREDLVERLNDAIELLQSAQRGDLITKSGIDSGQLITYSADWAAVAMCESTGRWHINTGLFDGGLQFLPSTWWGFGGGEYAPYAYMATPRQQIDIAERVLAVQGPEAWPNCFKALPADTDE